MKRIALLTLCLLLSVAAGAQSQPQKSTSIVTIAGESYYVHTVRPGETLYSLAKTYDTGEEAIRRSNPHTAEGLQAGQVLKIPVAKPSDKPLSDRKKKRLFDVHTVNQGETAYSISKRYGIGLDVLMEDNEGFDPTHLSIGQQINIRKASQGKSDNEEIEEQIESYKEALNSVSDRFTHHVVERGETLYSLGKRYGMPADSIVRYNESVGRDGLKVGAILRIPQAVPHPETPVQPDAFVVPADSLAQPSGGNLSVKPIDESGTIRIAMLLPLQTAGKPNRQFLEFYEGALLALEDLKSLGVSTKLDLFNTGRSAAETEGVLQAPEVQQADLIIGPIYDECYPPVAAFASRYGIPVVSPLAAVESADHSLLFQAAPPAATKNEKLRAELSPDNQVIVVSASRNDGEFQSEITPLLPPGAIRLNYTKGMGNEALENALSGDKANVIVVLSSDETTTDGILAYISTVQNSLIARGIKHPAIRVIGSSRWTRFTNIEKTYFFKLNLRYVTSYHADRGNERVAGFDRRYIAEFGSQPTLFSYRGYDVTKLFVGEIKLHGADFAGFLNNGEMTLLQTPYRFAQKGPGHKYENDEWALVCYNNDYTIDVR